MNELIYSFRDSNIRVINRNGQAWFVAADVCNLLGHTNTTMALQRLDHDERAKLNLGRQGETNLVNEFGLYTLVLNSRKPEAREFKRWITHEVIPSIRKHGAYATERTLERMINDPDTTIKLLQALKEEQQQAKFLREKAIENAPKVLLANAISDSDKLILMRDLAIILNQNGINIGQNRLYEVLRQKGYLVKGGSSKNLPTQRSVELGLFKVVQKVVEGSNGLTYTTSKVTGKGVQYFVNKFLNGDLNNGN